MSGQIILDTNPLLLFVVGRTNLRYISVHKRLRNAFDETDFKNLVDLLEESSVIVLTPNVLTETSNLARYIDDPAKTEISKLLAKIISNGHEHFVSSKSAAARKEYVRLGLTDSVLLEAASLSGKLLTADAGLYEAALRANLAAQNFNHVKQMRPDFQ
jgi:hypothetical protein